MISTLSEYNKIYFSIKEKKQNLTPFYHKNPDNNHTASYQMLLELATFLFLVVCAYFSPKFLGATGITKAKCNFCGDKHVYPSTVEANLKKEDLIKVYQSEGRESCRDRCIQ